MKLFIYVEIGETLCTGHTVNWLPNPTQVEGMGWGVGAGGSICPG